jgi:hypothetical protein
MAIEFVHIEFRKRTDGQLGKFFDFILFQDKVSLNPEGDAYGPQDKPYESMEHVSVKSEEDAKRLFLMNYSIDMMLKTDNEFPAWFSLYYEKGRNRDDDPNVDRAVISFNSWRYAYENTIDKVPFNDYIRKRWLHPINEKFDVLRIYSVAKWNDEDDCLLG